MSLVPSLLQAIVHVDGEALVMHAGDKPYVVTPGGQVDLASQGLTLDAVNGIISQLLPVEVMHALDEFGAAQYQLPTRPDFPHEQFTVVAARGGDDLWAEIRRRRIPEEDQIPEEIFGSAATQGSTRQSAAAAYQPVAPPAAAPAGMLQDDGDHVSFEELGVGPSEARAAYVLGDHGLDLPDHHALFAAHEPRAEAAAPADELEEIHQLAELSPEPGPVPVQRTAPLPAVPDVQAPPPAAAREFPGPAVRQADTPTPTAPVVHQPAAATVAPPVRVIPEVAPPAAAVVAPPPVVLERAAPTPAPPPVSPHLVVAPPPAVVLPMSRNPIRPESPATISGQSGTGLDRLLRLASARGASTLYLATDSQPSVRVDGEHQHLEGEPVLSAYDVESLLLTLMPERSHEALRTGAATEWICDIEGIGRIRCMSFRDHRGPGGVFRLMPVRAVSMDQLALSREIQALAIEPEGLVLVAGPRSSGKRTLISAFIDLINRTRRDHVISIESEINIVHERGASFVSQREVRGSSEDVLAAVRAALREDPDVLVIEDLRTGALMNAALEAAASGHLVIGGFSAHSATGAIDRIIDLYAPEYRRQIQMALAEQVRGVVVQVLLRRQGGGRIAARELLLNTPAVASVIAEGKTSQLPMAIEGGRRHGMVPLNDALVGFVQSGVVDVREAYRRSPDRGAFLSLLKRQGVDTSALERLA